MFYLLLFMLYLSFQISIVCGGIINTSQDTPNESSSLTLSDYYENYTPLYHQTKAL